MQITAPPIPFYRAASNRPPEVSQTAADRLKLLEQWRAIRAEGATAFEEAFRERGVLLFVLPPHSPKLKATRAPDACRGVLQLLRRGVDDGAVEPRAAEVGGAFLYENRRQSLGWRTPMEYLAERRLEEAS